MVIPGLSLGPCCCSCLSCDRLSGYPRAPGLRGLDKDSISLGEVGQPRGFLLRLCWAFCCCCPTLIPGHRGGGAGSARAWRLLLSPLSSKSPQQHIPRRGSQRTQKISLPSLGTQDLLVLYLSVRGGGPSAHLSLGRPPSPQASLLHREQVLLSASSVLSWCSGLRQGGLSQGG